MADTPRRALITGITGQDGSYLAEYLLDLGYEVHGIVRRVALEDPSHRLSRLANVRSRLKLHSGSLESFPSLFSIVNTVQPDELYHLAAQSFVSYSFEDSYSTFRTNIDGTYYLLESVRQAAPKCRFYFAGSSEMFGNVDTTPQTEATAFHPRSSYGISKVTGFHLCRNYRETYNVFAAAGMLFNHESPRRGFEFVTRKISWNVARIRAGQLKKLPLGNLDAVRDWGFAGDYIRAMHQMLRMDSPSDYVIATGEPHTVREFCELAFAHAGLDYREHVVVDPALFRPAEANPLVGDSTRARTELGWQPTVKFPDLVRMMVEHDISHARPAS